MNGMNRLKRALNILAGVAVAGLFCLVPAFGQAQQDADLDPNATEDMIPEWIKPSDYTYSAIGKPDPFESFVKVAPPPAPVASKRPSRPLTPLEQVEVSQLEVVGILWYPDDQNRVMAMAKMPDGKGFVLRKGTKVGQHNGEVVEIKPDEVVVREEVMTIFGKQETRYKTLKLYHGSGEGQ